MSNTQELSHEYFLRLPLPQGWRKKHKSQACKYNQVLWFKKKERKKKAMLILLAIVEQKMCLVPEITILCYFKKNIMKQLGQWGVSPCRWYSCIRNKGTREKQAPISDQRRGWNILGRSSFVYNLDCVVYNLPLWMIFWDLGILWLNSSQGIVWEESLLRDPLSSTFTPFQTVLP